MSELNQVLAPGKTLGVFGGGQLGRMFCQAATRLGYKTHIYCPEAGSPAFEVSTAHTQADYDDANALKKFGESVDVVTFEFENIPIEVLQHLPASLPVCPGGNVLHVSQHRMREKHFLSSNGFPVAPYLEVHSAADLEKASSVGFPSILKTAGFGYDGKGQTKVQNLAEAKAAFEKSGGQPMVLEGFVDFQCEVSVIVARDIHGKTATWGVFENLHRHHILDLTLWPSSLSAQIEKEASDLALAIAKKLQVVGLLAVEFFVEKSGRLVVNEMAPRPHNSGHITMDASHTGQFEQHVRAITGIGLGKTDAKSHGAMANLLGDVWKNGEPRWENAKQPGVFLHLYGKKEARPGRKMGHLNVLSGSSGDAAKKAAKIRESL